jgi:hypothetical protein
MHLRVPPDFVQRKWMRLDYNTNEKQKCFNRTVEENPSLGKHVRELHWTILDLECMCADEWEDAEIERELRALEELKWGPEKQSEREGSDSSELYSGSLDLGEL